MVLSSRFVFTFGSRFDGPPVAGAASLPDGAPVEPEHDPRSENIEA
jgi:hypothetical protein